MHEWNMEQLCAMFWYWNYNCKNVFIFLPLHYPCWKIERNLRQFQNSKLVGFSKTRWLTLRPAIERILNLYEPLKEFFLLEVKCPSVLKDFFNKPSSEILLFFIHSEASIFHVKIAFLESQFKLAKQKLMDQKKLLRLHRSMGWFF